MITIKELQFSRGSQVILDHIDLKAETAEILSVIGPSGCGKTTLLKCLAGLERPDSGQIVIDFGDGGPPPVDIAKLDEYHLNEVRRRVGMVFQYAALFDSMTVYDNVAFPMHRFEPDKPEPQVKEEVTELLDMVGLNASTDLSKMPAELSGGMRKRVGLARALALKPRVILYDEPSSGLDPVSAANIDRLIVQMKNQVGVTSVVVSHHVKNVLETSDKVAMLFAGKVLAIGTPDEIENHADERVRQFITGSADGPLTDVES